LCLNRTLKYKSPDVLALIVFPLTSYHMVPLALSSYPSLHRSSSHRFTPLFLTATPPFLHRYPAFRTIHRVVYASVTVQERVPERVPVNYNTLWLISQPPTSIKPVTISTIPKRDAQCRPLKRWGLLKSIAYELSFCAPKRVLVDTWLL